MAKVLLVTKTSTWDWHGAWYQSQVQSGALPEADIKQIKLAHADHLESVTQAQKILNDQGLPFRTLNVDDESWQPDSDTEIMITLGGDGTLLSASHRVESVKIQLVGIRSSGTSVGYLCAGGIEKMELIILSLLKGDLKFTRACRLRAKITPADGSAPRFSPPALNDFLYSNANPAATTRYTLNLGNRREEHKSSGMWISTALGSTAGICAAGGVIMPREDTNFQFVVREIYRAPGKNVHLVTGFFNPDERTLVIENRSEKAIVAADGSRGIMQIEWGDKVEFHRAPCIRIAKA
jgi:NAD+ kinase